MIVGPNGKVKIEDEHVRGFVLQIAEVLKAGLDTDAAAKVAWSEAHHAAEYAEFMLREAAR